MLNHPIYKFSSKNPPLCGILNEYSPTEQLKAQKQVSAPVEIIKMVSGGLRAVEVFINKKPRLNRGLLV